MPCTPCNGEAPAEGAATTHLDGVADRGSLEAHPPRTNRGARPARAATCATRRVPSTDGPSSSLVIQKCNRPLVIRCVPTNSSVAWTIAASPALHVGRSRPYSTPSRICGANDRCSTLQRTGGHHVGGVRRSRTPVPPRPPGPEVLDTTTKAQLLDGETRRREAAIMSCWQPSSAGVTERRAMRAFVNSMVCDITLGGLWWVGGARLQGGAEAVRVYTA